LRQGYPITFGVGLVVLAFVLLLNFARAARAGAGRPEDRAQLMAAGWRLALYAPMVMLLPGLVAGLMVMLQQLGDVALASSAAKLPDFFAALGRAYMNNPLDAVVSGGLHAFLLLVSAVLLVICLLMWLIQDWVAGLAVLLLVLAAPVVLALAAQPKAQHRLGRFIGVLAGAMLTPFVTRFAFYALGPVLVDAINSESVPTLGIFKFVIFLAVATSAPILLSMLMPHLIDGAGSVAAGVGAGVMLGQAGQHGMDAAQRLVQRYGSGSSSSAGAASKGASAAGGGAAAGGGGAAAGGAAASGGGAAASAGGGALLGAVAAPLAVVAAGVAVGQAITNAGRGQMAQTMAASGAGHTSDQTSGSHVPQVRDSGRAGVQSRDASRGRVSSTAGSRDPNPPVAPRPPDQPVGGVPRGSGAASGPVAPPVKAPDVRQNPPVAGGGRR